MSTLRNRTSLPVAALLVVLAVGIAGVLIVPESHLRAQADTTTPMTDEITVSGVGTVEGVPDTLLADFDISVKRPSVQQAINASDRAAGKAIAALTHDGVAGKDIQSQDAFVEASYNRYGIDGYRAGQTLAVSIHPLRHVGKVLGDTTTSDGNAVRLDGVSYDIRDNAQLLLNAQTKAFSDAETAAQHDAALAHRSLARVVSMNQTINRSSSGSAALSGDAMRSVAPIPIEPGQQPVSVAVKVVWALS